MKLNYPTLFAAVCLVIALAAAALAFAALPFWLYFVLPG